MEEIAIRTELLPRLNTIQHVKLSLSQNKHL